MDMLDETFRLATFLLESVAISVICLIGIVGNVLSVVVLRFDKTSTATSFLLQALACADVLLLLDSLVYLCPRGFFLYYEDSAWSVTYFRRYYWSTVPYLWSIGMVAQTAVNWLVVLITLERYMVVCRPLNANRVSTAGTAKIAACLVMVLAVLYNLPRLFEWELRTVHFVTPLCTESPSASDSEWSPWNATSNTDTSSSRAELVHRTALQNASDDTQVETESESEEEVDEAEAMIFTHDGYLRRLPLYNYLYRIVLYAVCVAVGPLVLLVSVNIKLIGALRKADETRAKLSVYSSSGSRAATRRLVDCANSTPVSQSESSRRKLCANSSGRRANLFVNQRTYTRLVVILVTTFLVCQTPAMLHQVLAALAFHTLGEQNSPSEAVCAAQSANSTFVQSDSRTKGDFVMVFSSYVSNLLVVFNCSANFLLYCVYGKKFRILVKRMFLHRCDRQQLNRVLRSISGTPFATPNKLPGPVVVSNAYIQHEIVVNNMPIRFALTQAAL